MNREFAIAQQVPWAFVGSFISPYFTSKRLDTIVVIEINAIAIRPTPIDDHLRRIESRMRFEKPGGVLPVRCGHFMAGP